MADLALLKGTREWLMHACDLMKVYLQFRCIFCGAAGALYSKSGHAVMLLLERCIALTGLEAGR